MSSRLRSVFGLVLAGAAPGCSGGDGGKPTGDSSPTTPALQWFTTCGDPVCQGYTGPFTGVSACVGEVEGATCDAEGAQCDPVDDCDALLVCATEDPKQQPGGCPISRAAHKRDLAYLDAAGRKAAADEALSLRLATWRYNWEGDAARPHLGFLIDDAPTSRAVRADGEVVDLYGYTSLVLSAVQQQQAEIERLRAEVEALSATCSPRP